jgi:hypothetical protein
MFHVEFPEKYGIDPSLVKDVSSPTVTMKTLETPNGFTTTGYQWKPINITFDDVDSNGLPSKLKSLIDDVSSGLDSFTFKVKTLEKEEVVIWNVTASKGITIHFNNGTIIMSITPIRVTFDYK